MSLPVFSCGVPAAAVHSNSHRYKINNSPGLRIFSQIPCIVFSKK